MISIGMHCVGLHAQVCVGSAASRTNLVCGLLQGSDQFDIETTPQRLPQKHVVAVRITSENASDGFKPTAGRVDEVCGS